MASCHVAILGDLPKSAGVEAVLRLNLPFTRSPSDFSPLILVYEVLRSSGESRRAINPGAGCSSPAAAFFSAMTAHSTLYPSFPDHRGVDDTWGWRRVADAPTPRIGMSDAISVGSVRRAAKTSPWLLTPAGIGRTGV